MSAFGGKADIAAKPLTRDDAADRGEYRKAAGATALGAQQAFTAANRRIACDADHIPNCTSLVT